MADEGAGAQSEGARATGRRRRLAEELVEAGLPLGEDDVAAMLLDEIDYAQRPPVHERRVPSVGSVVGATASPDAWSGTTGLTIQRWPLAGQRLGDARRFADGRSTWLLRHDPNAAEWLLFDRPSGSERDLVVLADGLKATLIQLSSAGVVRVVGGFGVLRWEGLGWHHEPPLRRWSQAVAAGSAGDPAVLDALMEFAMHDLGARGIGSTLVYDPADDGRGAGGHRPWRPPALAIASAPHLAPLRHALAQVDGATFFDVHGVLRRLAVRLVPSSRAEQVVPSLGGTRHTSARRFSYDAPTTTVIVVSDDGPVSVLRGGELLARPGPE